MNRHLSNASLLAGLALLGLTGVSRADNPIDLPGAVCARPAYLHCPDADCTADRVINPGPVVEMKSRRTFFLDYPCDLKPDEDVTVILSLHGGGSYANWQRHYFPLLDYVDQYRLVVATPSSPIRVWTEADDGYLQNIVDAVVDELGPEHVRAFWLAGHSQGGMTSNRLLRTDYFKQRVDGWMSLSGGRLGGSPGLADGFGPPRSADSPAPPRSGTNVSAMIEAARKRLSQLPATEFSFIFETGEREMNADGLPDTSAWADKLGCNGRKQLDDVVDTRPGYVYDGTRQDPPNPSWGLLPRPGRAEVYQYQGCRDGRVVADVVRREKGHTEGLEPKVTERLVALMVSAPGGRVRAMAERH